MRPRVAAINALEAELQAARRTTAFAPARPTSCGSGSPDGDRARRAPARGLRRVPGGGAADRRHAALRRPAHGRHGAPRGQDRRDGDRRGQDPGGDPARLPERASPGAACTSSRSTTTWPAATPSGWGPIYHALGLSVGGHPARGVVPLRPGLRARPTSGWPRSGRARGARPTAPTSPTAPTTSSASTTCATTCGSRLEEHGPARAPLRDRRRGRLDPDRRGADAADHLRARPRSRPTSTTRSTASSPGSRARPPSSRASSPRSRSRPQGDYIVDEKAQDGHADRAGRRPLRAAARRREPLRPRSTSTRSTTSTRRLTRPRPLPEGRGLRGQGRPGHHRRRVHRPAHAGPALVGRPAPGGRGQGRRPDRAREPDPRHHHLPELLPDVRQARRHDGHRRHRGRGVRQDLQARRHRRPDQPRRWSGSTTRTSSTRPSARSSTRSCEEIDELPREGPAGAGRAPSPSRSPSGSPSSSRSAGSRHQVLNAKYHEREAEIIAQAGPEKAVTIATNMAGRGTDILLGGNPEFLAKEMLRKKGLDPATAPAEARGRALEEARQDHGPGARARRRAGRPAHHRHRAPRVAARRQPAPRPLGPPGRPRLLALLPLARGRPPAHLRLRAHPADHGPPGDGGRASRSSTSS